jgi:uncharacterized protein YktB (UPF0637 family)
MSRIEVPNTINQHESNVLELNTIHDMEYGVNMLKNKSKDTERLLRRSQIEVKGFAKRVLICLRQIDEYLKVFLEIKAKKENAQEQFTQEDEKVHEHLVKNLTYYIRILDELKEEKLREETVPVAKIGELNSVIERSSLQIEKKIDSLQAPVIPGKGDRVDNDLGMFIAGLGTSLFTMGVDYFTKMCLKTQDKTISELASYGISSLLWVVSVPTMYFLEKSLFIKIRNVWTGESRSWLSQKDMANYKTMLSELKNSSGSHFVQICELKNNLDVILEQSVVLKDLIMKQFESSNSHTERDHQSIANLQQTLKTLKERLNYISNSE